MFKNKKIMITLVSIIVLSSFFIAFYFVNKTDKMKQKDIIQAEVNPSILGQIGLSGIEIYDSIIDDKMQNSYNIKIFVKDIQNIKLLSIKEVLYLSNNPFVFNEWEKIVVFEEKMKELKKRNEIQPILDNKYEYYNLLYFEFDGVKYINRILYVTFEKDGVIFENIPVDQSADLVKGLPIIPESSEVGDIIELSISYKFYKVYESAWEWIEEKPKYKEAIVPPGEYEVIKTYLYDGKKFANLEGIGWIYVSEVTDPLIPIISFNQYNTESLEKNSLTHGIVIENQPDIKIKDYRIEVYLSDSFMTFNSNELSSIKIENNDVHDLGRHSFSFEHNVDFKGNKYINKRLYVTYEVNGEQFKDLLIDQTSKYYE